MSTAQQKNTAIERQMLKFETIEGLQHALDRKYRQLLQAARADWERLFAGKDASDACGSVRVASEPIATRTSAIRGSGFLKLRRLPLKSAPKRTLPRFAH